MTVRDGFNILLLVALFILIGLAGNADVEALRTAR
jgi:hypothetical protein